MRPTLTCFQRFLFSATFAAASSLGAAVSPNVIVDQVGYFTTETKTAMLNSTPSGAVVVRSTVDGSSVYSGTASAAAYDAASGDQVCTFTFSALTVTGSYYLDAPGVGQSVTFTVSPTVYNAFWRTAMRGYYVQRCGTAVDMSPDFPGYTHSACHTDDADFDASSGKTGSKSSTGGWHDAGDYGKYIINANISVGELLWAFEHYGSAVASVGLNIPESGNGTPDILNEIRWELGWMLTMQDTDGGVWEKLTSTGFGSFVLPENDDASNPRLIIGGRTAAPWKDTGSTAGFAAVFAIASRVYQPYDAAFSAQCLSAATSAYAWMKTNPNVGCANPSTISTGDYCGTNHTADRLWAAAELLRTTGLATYTSDFEAAKGATPYVSGVQDWTNVNNLAMWAYAQAAGANAATVARIESDTLVDAASLTTTAAGNRYRNTLTTGQYIWGSNGETANMALLLLMANRFQPNPVYVQAALDDLHYLLGRNCFSTCWVTRVGTTAVLHPHHRPSGSPEYVNLPPWPGLMCGGPNSSGGDTLTDAISNTVPPMRHWTDQTMAYSCNEVALNWQAPLVYSVAAFYCAPTPTPTPSATGTPSATATPSGTKTMTATGTPSATATSTASGTSSATATPSATRTPSATATPSATRTPSATATPSTSGTPSASATPGTSGTPSASATPGTSGTPSVTGTPSPSGNSSQSPTNTRSESATMSETPSPSASGTPTGTATLSATPTESATMTATESLGTETGSPSATLSGSSTPSPTLTHSVTIAPSLAPSASPSFTATSEVSVEASATPTPGISATDLPGGPAEISASAPVPNPNPAFLDVLMEGPADAWELRIYTEALVRVATISGGSLEKGWNRVNVPEDTLRGLANGTYYYLVWPLKHGAPGRPVLGRLTLLR